MNGNGVNKDEVRALLQERRFGDLFRKLGWDNEGLRPLPPLTINDNEFAVEPVAEKRGFVVFICEDDDNRLASKTDRRKLTAKLARYHFEHLLIICGKNSQRWMLAIRPQDRPVQLLEAKWGVRQNIDLLANQLHGLFFHISDEDGLTITDVVEQVRSAFTQNAEAVTRRFYGKFQKELRDFAAFIKGVRNQVNREWYAALMLNRLMFIYFLQKRNFLDGNRDYLRDKLHETQKKRGKDKFDRTFYRRFLRRLFAGLDAPESERDPEMRDMIGRVPYLNGGLFDLHSIERDNEKINIPDRAFENLFAFFDKYKWHLDTRPAASGNEINPDVIGYIFEQYINDRADMGAYYTQEDVTGYIARNTIIPFLLERARKECASAFDAQNGIWRFLRESPGDFIHNAVKKGCGIPDSELPASIRRGLKANAPDLLERRKDWNKPADERFALPTETWRETVARRIRYHELFSKLKCGKIRSVEDLITHNLDIERFAAVALENYEGTDFIESFFAAIAGKIPKGAKQLRGGITVLDPACGSGAFLFAALNVLEPLYEKCVERMRVFVDEDKALREQGKRKGKRQHQQFIKVLDIIEGRNREKYWIYKQIILNNLFGADIMREAAETAKLRLFLKLAAVAGEADMSKDNLGLEPLPDIDFNIRHGNSLVGFASARQFDNFAKSSLLDQKAADDVREKMEVVRIADIRFRDSQDNEPKDYKKAKAELGERLGELNETLNGYLAEQYGASQRRYKQWKDSHRPFHWLAEFYDIVENSGGFNVVIGNPPYVGYGGVRKQYTVQDYRTERCDDLYAFLMERGLALSHERGMFGMIVPVSVASANNKTSLRYLLSPRRIYHSHYADRPSALFKGVHQMVSIVLSHKADAPVSHSSGFRHWYSEERENLFSLAGYTPSKATYSDVWQKQAHSIENVILRKLAKNKKPLTGYFGNSHPELVSVCSGTGGYFLRAFNQEENSTEYRKHFAPKGHAAALCAVINSNLFYWFWRKISNSRHLNTKDMRQFKIDITADLLPPLTKAGKKHIKALKATREHRAGKMSYDQFRPAKAKKQCDEIDAVLARHYGLTDEELDYIINYDIKYRTSQN